MPTIAKIPLNASHTCMTHQHTPILHRTASINCTHVTHTRIPIAAAQASLAERHGSLLAPDSEALPREELLRVNAQLRQALEAARTELLDCFNAVWTWARCTKLTGMCTCWLWLLLCSI